MAGPSGGLGTEARLLQAFDSCNRLGVHAKADDRPSPTRFDGVVKGFSDRGWGGRASGPPPADRGVTAVPGPHTDTPTCSLTTVRASLLSWERRSTARIACGWSRFWIWEEVVST